MIGKLLVGLGAILVLAGLAAMLAERLGIHWGRLPGDIVIRGKNSAFYFPIVTCVLVSFALTLILWLLGRWR